MLALKFDGKYAASGGTSRVLDNESVKIYYVDVGKSEDPGQQTVLLLHGMMQSSSNWGPRDTNLVDLLTEAGFRVLCPDNRGHGLSDTPTGVENYGLKTMDDCVALLDSLGIDKVHVVGHSYGCTLGLRIVVSNPRRILSFVAASGGWADKETGFKLLDDHYWTLCGLRIFWYPCCIPCWMRAATGESANPYGVYMMSYAQKNPGFMIEDSNDLERIAIPVQGIIGSEDPLLSFTEGMKVIPNYTLVVCEGKGHVDVLKDPKFSFTVMDFIKRCSQSDGGAVAPMALSMDQSLKEGSTLLTPLL